jgi:hypothetical protein
MNDLKIKILSNLKKYKQTILNSGYKDALLLRTANTKNDR